MLVITKNITWEVVIILLIIIQYNSSLFAQKLDTMDWINDGELMIYDPIINSWSGMKGGMLRGTYKIVDRNGDTIVDSVVDSINSKTYYELKIVENGEDFQQAYIKNDYINVMQYSLNHSSGKRMENQTHTKYTVVESGYYDNEKNTLQATIISQDVYSEYDSLRFDYKSSDDFDSGYLVEMPYDSNKVSRSAWIEYYENGSIKRTGTFSNKNFWLFDSEMEYQKWIQLGQPEKFIHFQYKSLDIKHGVWSYYTEKGEVELIEIYEHGLLLKSFEP